MNNIKDFIDFYYDEKDNFFITAIEHKSNKTLNFYHNRNTFSKYYNKLIKYNNEYSLYFTLNTLLDKNDCKLNEYNYISKCKDNIKKVKAIIFDFDDVETSKVNLVRMLKILDLIPTYILETSKNKFQVCFKLEDEKIDFKEFEALNKTLAKYFNSDINVCSIEKVFRLPFSTNKKNDFQTKLLKFNPNNTYSFSSFISILKNILIKNYDLNKYYNELINKNKPKQSKKPKLINKNKLNEIKKISKVQSNKIATTLEIDNKLIGKYKRLLKYNNDDASIVDILFIKDLAKKDYSFDDIWDLMLSIRENIGKPLQRDYNQYYDDRYNIYLEV